MAPSGERYVAQPWVKYPVQERLHLSPDQPSARAAAPAGTATTAPTAAAAAPAAVVQPVDTQGEAGLTKRSAVEVGGHWAGQLPAGGGQAEASGRRTRCSASPLNVPHPGFPRMPPHQTGVQRPPLCRPGGQGDAAWQQRVTRGIGELARKVATNCSRISPTC